MCAGYPGTQWKAELIFDAEGKLVYFATCIPDNTWQYSGHIHTTKWYSHPDYADDKTNPGRMKDGKQSRLIHLQKHIQENIFMKRLFLKVDFMYLCQIL